eukprot:CAMPEP_0198724528 /NCGR_PEP_ID=MMETSP1475-20131203/1985_1 /TAXON_ID= ORGANISM="Unidentified sp., Strain CCMP1999" /NCGR_SAMPLE_ID=MMETSP1475 /ASSEMBLY_ACC=CAM_ASM_001111 /LENGTH=312 /DNA_ID=CAMNT_0044486079 /DNA_START=145 /DNA_END=1080 /DNA_ORIENTATION=-
MEQVAFLSSAVGGARGSFLGQRTAYGRIAQRPIFSAAPTAKRSVIKCQAPDRAPDVQDGWEPEKDGDYAIVKIFSLSPVDKNVGGRLLVLKPIRPSPRALKLSVTRPQAESIMNVLKKDIHGPARPITHDLIHTFIQSQKAKILKVAITHTDGVIFYARVWMRVQDNTIVNLDARPSDALALAVRCRAPVYLNMRLMEDWGTPIKIVEKEVERGAYDRLQSIYVAMDGKQDLKLEQKETLKTKLEKKRMELQLAVRLQRFTDAAKLRDELQELCPIDQLRLDLEDAVKEQRYLDAAKIRDQIFDWELKFFLW